MHDLLPALYGLISGIISILVYEQIKKKFTGYKYKWTCPQCNKFRVSGTSSEGVELIKQSHHCEV